MSPANISTRAGRPHRPTRRVDRGTRAACRVLSEPDGRQPAAATDGRPLGEVTLVALDMRSAEITDRGDLGRPLSARRRTRAGPPRRGPSSRAEREPRLLDISLDVAPSRGGTAAHCCARTADLLGWCLRGGSRSRRRSTTSPRRMQPCRHRPGSHWMVWMQPAGRCDQLLSAGIELCFGQPLLAPRRPAPRLRDCPPLQLRRFGIEPQLARDLRNRPWNSR